MKDGPRIEDDRVRPGAFHGLEPVHGADDVGQPGHLAVTDEADDPGPFADPFHERHVDAGVEIGPAGRGLAPDLVENDLAVEGQVEGVVQAGHPAGLPQVHVVFFRDQSVFVRLGEIQEQYFGHGRTPCDYSGPLSD